MPRNGFALSLPAAFVLIVGFSVSAMVTWLVSHRDRQHAHEQFVEAATSRYLLLRHDLDTLIAACRLLTRPPSPNPEPALKTLQAAWPSVTTLEWRVQDTSRDGTPEYRLADAHPVSYRIRLASDDHARVPALREALTQAWESDSIRVTAVTQLNSSAPDYRGEVRIVVPVRRHPTSADATHPMQEEGLYAVSLDLQRWLVNQVQRFAREPLRIELYDLAWHTREPVVAHGQADLSESDGDARHWLYTNVLSLPGREWLLRVRPTSAYLAEHQSRLPLVLFLSGTLITVLITLLISPGSGHTESDDHVMH